MAMNEKQNFILTDFNFCSPTSYGAPSISYRAAPDTTYSQKKEKAPVKFQQRATPNLGGRAADIQLGGGVKQEFDNGPGLFKKRKFGGDGAGSGGKKRPQFRKRNHDD